MDHQPSSLCKITILLLLLSFISSSQLIIAAQVSEFDTVANLSNSWINNPQQDSISINTTQFPQLRRALTPILFSTSNNGSRFVCGFYCLYNETANCLFGVLIFQNGVEDKNLYIINEPQLVWSANRNHPVTINATLNFTGSGDMVIRDADGSLVWSTSTGDKNVSGLKLTEIGNLVLYSKNKEIVWQSFDHPTDSLLPGQTLVTGQNLTSSISTTNWTQGLYSLVIQSGLLLAYVESNPPQKYFQTDHLHNQYVEFNGESFKANEKFPGSASWFVRLEPEGHLKAFVWGGSDANVWNVVVNDKVGYYFLDSSQRGCLFLSDVFSRMTNGGSDKVSVLPKVEKSSQKKSGRMRINLGSSLGASFVSLFLFALYFLFYKIRNKETEDFDDIYVDQMPGMPTRFSYENLKQITSNFNNKLGQGGFGSVYEGTLDNGIKVAVKHLDGLGNIKKSFLAEVETIGSIHHVNLVSLIGYCAEKSQRLLVYEYMSNGTLDKWIFQRNEELTLEWQHRKKIILDIAKGLAYLHGDCKKKIFHLDIKPQNILLDENFGAKISDFGLAKLIDKDKSRVVTTLRGTPGYLAPEWLSSIITEKVDVYSFGVVVLEILCGRKNIDDYQSEEEMHLVTLLKTKAEDGRLEDMVDKHNEDMQLYGAEVVEMMKVVVWCLQSDFSKRPTMSVVVKVLEGCADVENNLDYNFTNVAPAHHLQNAIGDATPLLPLTLSGPR